MKIVKRLRKARNLELEEFAKSIGASASQVKSWENGSKEPSTSDLKDIAFYFNTSVDELLNANEDDSIKISTNTYHLLTDSEKEDGFWGHIGILLKGHDKSKWYPITLDNAEYLSDSINSLESENTWLMVETLNNRILLFNPTSVRRIWLLDDGADQPDDDWDVPFDGYEGQPAEFYKTLENYEQGNNPAEAEVSLKLFEHCEAFTDVLDMGENEIIDFLYNTHIYDNEGIKTSYWVDDNNLIALIDSVEHQYIPLILDLGCDYFDSYFPSKSLCLIDIPRQLVANARAAENARTAEEDDNYEA